MISRTARLWGGILLLVSARLAGAPGPEPADPVRFSRDVRPILAESCLLCHGPDEKQRKAGLRLDRPEGWLAPLSSGRKAVVPGDRDRSALIARVTASDPGERMPPPNSGKTLSAAQIDTLRRWIDEGAAWEPHWSYAPPRRPAVPELPGGAPPGAVDAFLLCRLAARGLSPAEEADRRALARRASLDLCGLPPAPEEVDAFVADERPDAFERLVDRLLASPAFGERLAIWWLDLVRYADSVGYHGDQEHAASPYRDWVIAAFNDNLPFDRFTIEQLAGDLLPGATREQLVASAYNRLNMTTEEGGAQAGEYLARWLVSKSHPLTARVVMNRLWRLFLGSGIAEPLDDFGLRSEWPENSELLDWLAVELIESGWDLKRAVRTIVLSSAYRRSSIPTAQLAARDPRNTLFGRQARPRLDAELVRDLALAASGLLVPRLGGPSSRPYQPDGYYAHLNFPPRTYVSDQDANQFRRGVYMHWQRTFLHPALLAFDAPSREESCAERARSNTPRAALALLNDPTFVEAARALAARVLREGGADPRRRIERAFELVLSRPPSAGESRLLLDLASRHHEHYRAHEDAARALIATGISAIPAGLETAELAAWTSVARVILNLSESMTRS